MWLIENISSLAFYSFFVGFWLATGVVSAMCFIACVIHFLIEDNPFID